MEFICINTFYFLLGIKRVLSPRQHALLDEYVKEEMKRTGEQTTTAAAGAGL